MEEFHVIIDSDLEAARSILSQADRLEMLGDYYHYIFTNLDVYTLDLESYKESGCNVTGIRLVDIESRKAQDLIHELTEMADMKKMLLLPTIGIQTNVAVMTDSVTMLGQIVRKMSLGLHPPSGVNCDSDVTWRNGSTFKSELRMIQYQKTNSVLFLLLPLPFFIISAVASSIQPIRCVNTFNPQARPFIHTTPTCLGKWNSTDRRMMITRNYAESLKEVLETLENKTLRITVHREEPFVMYKQSADTKTGNDRYEGYCIDLLEEIAKLRKFNYTIHEVKDSAYGSKMASGKWNGMVGELQRGEADLAAASLTISYSRSEVIDFTVPFMHLGISILFRVSMKRH